MSEHFWTTLQTVLGGFLACGGGLISGWLLNKNQRKSEKRTAIESRRREFTAFAHLLKTQAINTGVQGWDWFYHNRIFGLRHQAEIIFGDLNAKEMKQLDGMVASLCDLDAMQIADWGEKQNVVEKIGKIVDFSKNLPKP